MPITEALMIAASGIIVVFIMLVVLWLLINVINVATKALEKKQHVGQVAVPKAVAVPEPAAAPKASEEVVYGGEIALYDVDEKTAACIMAIVSDETKIPLNQLIFKSIKAI